MADSFGQVLNEVGSLTVVGVTDDVCAAVVGGCVADFGSAVVVGCRVVVNRVDDNVVGFVVGCWVVVVDVVGVVGIVADAFATVPEHLQ